VTLGILAPMALSTTCTIRRKPEASPPEVPTTAPIPVAPMVATLPGDRPPYLSPLPPAPPAATLSPGPADVPAVDPAPDEGPAAPSEIAPAPSASRSLVLADELPYRSPYARSEGGADRPRSSPPRRRRGARPYHPDPRVFIEVVEARGGLTIPELQRTVRGQGYGPVRRCYEEGLRREQHLSGQIALDLTIYAAGAASRARVASSSVGDESVALCVGREVEHLLVPAGPAPTDLRVEVTLSTGDEPVQTPQPAPNAEALRDALRASWPAVEQCYAAELARRPGVGGRLELRFRAMSTGEVVDVAEGGESRFAENDVTRCVLGVYRSARLPAGRICSSRPTSFYYAVHLEARR